jgi:quercetin dioxygenase-like cupin family protein
MKKSSIVLALGAALSAGHAVAEPSFLTPEFQNSQVHVVRIRLEPHQRISMHEVPPHVTVWLTDGDLRITLPNGQSDVQHFHAGQVQWVTLGRHAGENVGEKAVEFVAVEPVSSGAPR